MAAEAIGGWLTNSLALLSDAGHMFTDVAAIALSLAALWFASRPAPPAKTYGYYRLEILAAFANGVTLAVVAVAIVLEGIERIQAPPEVESGTMMVIAAGGLAVNLAGAWILRHGHSEGANLNLRGAFLHVLGDLLGSVGALVAGLCMWLWGWMAADAIVSIGISLLIVLSSTKLIRDAVNVLLEATPSHISIASVREELLRVEGVIGVHDLHVWTITSGHDALSAHVVCCQGSYSKETLRLIRERLYAAFNIGHVTIQLEPPDTETDQMTL
jgi:cobalt-zinc-cadmium efflux system protein